MEKRATWIAGVAAFLGVVGAVIAFLFSANLKLLGNPQPTSVDQTVTEHPTVPVTTGLTGPGEVIYSGVLSITGTADINLDTNPPAVGKSSNPTITVDAISSSANFRAELPSSLASVSTSQAPTLNRCLSVIAVRPTLMIDARAGEWLCARTANGATAAIGVTSLKSAIIILQVIVWQS